MYDKSDFATLELILSYIIDIYKCTERHGSIESALNDFEGKHSIFNGIIHIRFKL